MPTAALLRIRGEDLPRKVLYDINALDDVELYLGSEVRDVFRDGAISLKVRATRALLWGGLKHADPVLTPPAVGALMQRHLDAGGAMADFYTAILDALTNSGVLRQPDAEESSGGAEGNAARPAPTAGA